MLYSIGTKVKFRHTGDEGVVTAILEGGLVNVRLRKENMEIPAFTDDLIRMDGPTPHPVKAKFAKGKAQTPEPFAVSIPIETQYAILKSLGIQLAFESVENRDGTIEKYLVYLINDTPNDVLFSLEFMLNKRKKFLWDNKLKATSFIQVGEILNDELNDAPEFKMECRWLSTEGVGEAQAKNLKIKPKTFYNSQRTAPLLNKPVFHYRLFESAEKDPENPSKEDLKAYTKRHSAPSWKLNPESRGIEIHDSKEFAEFSAEIDLHIEKLTPLWQKMGNAEIMRFQLLQFEKFLEQAIRLGVPSVFIIHGVGEGHLKNEIATRLLKNPDVTTFKNEFHPKYGWGATEVVL